MKKKTSLAGRAKKVKKVVPKKREAPKRKAVRPAKFAKKKYQTKLKRKTSGVKLHRKIAEPTNETQLTDLIQRGKPKGFVTDLEILDYFPSIEDNPDFLDTIYAELEKHNIKVVEVESLIQAS